MSSKAASTPTTQKSMIKMKKKKSSLRKETYALYIHRVLKEIHPELGISSRGMSVVDSLVRELFDMICTKAFMIAKISGKMTVSAVHVQAGIRTSFPRDLAKHSVSDGSKSVTKYSKAKGP